MLILGLETATDVVSVALGRDGELLASLEVRRPRHHAELLVPMVEDLCRRSGCDLDQITRIAVDVGPGLFTGLRVGIATATALARGLDVDIVGISSLEILACAHVDLGCDLVPVLDARKAEVYHARFSPDGESLALRRPMAVASLEDLLSELVDVDADLALVGAGAHRYRNELEARGHRVVARPATMYPSAATLALVAMAPTHRERFGPPDAIRPHYLRAPDAEISWVTRQGAS